MSWRECNLELLKQINIGRVHHPPMSNNMAPFALCTPLPPLSLKVDVICV